jgi:hypothetical protein
MRDHARLRDRRGDVGDPAHHAPCADDGADALNALDAVLEGHDHAAAADERACPFGRALGIPELDREQHDVGRGKRARIVGDDGTLEMYVAARAAHDEPALAHRGEMRAAGDERDVVARLREPGAEIAADPTGTHDRDAHVDLRIGPRRGLQYRYASAL